ncbi:MAG: hypothetical protein Q7S31_00700, partial [bacterium]|nr:hypothetical protein [bacterium]
MPWKEFEGVLDPKTSKFNITSQNPIEAGDEVVLSKRVEGLLRLRVVEERRVKIIDANTAVLEIRRPRVDIVNIGHVPDFGFASHNYEFGRDEQGFHNGTHTLVDSIRVTK